MVCLCVFCLCVFAVTVFLWSEWMSDLSQEKEHPSRRSLLQWFTRRCLCAESTDLSLWACLSRKTMLEFASAFSAGEKHWHLDENAHRWLATHQDRPSPPPRAYLQRSNLTCFHKTRLKPPPPVQRFHVPIGRNPMSASSPPSLPRAFLHSLSPHRPSSPSSSQSPPGPLYMRLSNGSHSVSSPTNSRGSFHGVSFLLQIGLTRETVNLEASDLSLSAVKDLVCSIVDQKVRTLSPSKPLCWSVSRKCYFWSVFVFFSWPQNACFKLHS